MCPHEVLKPQQHISIGLLAHVDAGKTTLSEALLYESGSIRHLGRVDNRDAYLDTNAMERERGITIFSKQARMNSGTTEYTLLDTPGHVDFSAEMERTLQVLDYAVLIISGADGVQGHTRTLWRLLEQYQVPVFLFVNKMDQPGVEKERLLEEVRQELSGNCVDFTEAESVHFYEEAAMCGEEAHLEYFMEHGKLEDTVIRSLIRHRRMFPCYFGSALKLTGVTELIDGMNAYMEQPVYPQEFGARVFKITRDDMGNRLTHLKLTGGSLGVKAVINGEKVNQIRVYSGDRYEAVTEAVAGMVCAVTGLEQVHPGEGLGCESGINLPILEPVLTYAVELPEGQDAALVLPKLRQLEEEEPQLHILWQEETGEIQIALMGEVQIEVLKRIIYERFGIEVQFGTGHIVYKETIADTVEGVGHFEPLRHYAEVHLLLEPAETGTGLQFEAACSEDVLDKNWQRLVLTHLREREHKGVLTGAPITDMKITLVGGRAHTKHTEGGDFRQATYRAVRQGLMQAQSVLLEPYYAFRLELPESCIGRAMTDMERMKGSMRPPEVVNGRAVLCGEAPAVLLQGYPKEVTAYAKGDGHIELTLAGYRQCHNPEEVIEKTGYDPKADLENTPDSVFCAHGAGFIVSWDRVRDYMHVESALSAEQEERVYEQMVIRSQAQQEETWIGTDEIDAILEKTFHANSKEKLRRKNGVLRRQKGEAPIVRTYAKQPVGEEYLLVDGYNVIFAWDELKELAKVSIDGARGRLLDILCNYQGIRGCQLIVVFDAYRVVGHATEIYDYHNIHVVYTKEAETADQYIEKFAHQNGRKYRVTVATSDGLEQIIIRGAGCTLLSSRDLEKEIERASKQVQEDYTMTKVSGKQYLLDGMSETLRSQIPQEGEDA